MNLATTSYHFATNVYLVHNLNNSQTYHYHNHVDVVNDQYVTNNRNLRVNDNHLDGIIKYELVVND